jgi:hypothetical protein
MSVTRRQSSPIRRSRTGPLRRTRRVPVVASDVVFLEPGALVAPPVRSARPVPTRTRASRDTIAPKRSKPAAKVARTKRKLSSIRDNRYAKRKGPGRTRTMV